MLDKVTECDPVWIEQIRERYAQYKCDRTASNKDYWSEVMNYGQYVYMFLLICGFDFTSLHFLIILYQLKMSKLASFETKSLVRPLCYRINQTKTPHFTGVFFKNLN